MIIDPITILPNQSIEQALALMNRYRISGIPVVQGKKLVGILTNRDLRFETRMHLKVSDVMTKENLITAPEGTSFKELPVLLSGVFYIAVFIISGCAPAPKAQKALPDFTLTAVTVDGTSPFDLRTLRGRAWIADFVYTRCAGPCPMLTANMAGLQKNLPKSIGLLSLTVDPDHDEPEVLALYARKFKADPQRWFFLTGEKAELIRLVRDGFLLPVVENAAALPGERFAHSAKFVLIDADARVRGWYDGDDATALDKLAADARKL